MNLSTILSDLVAPAVIAAVVSGLFNLYNNIRVEQRKRLQDVKDFLMISRQELESNGELVSVRAFLQKEHNEKGSDNPIQNFPDGMTAYSARRLPGFVERVGIHILHKAPNNAEMYESFREEVRLCANSNLLWVGDDWKTSPFWSWFRKFVESTDRFAPRA